MKMIAKTKKTKNKISVQPSTDKTDFILSKELFTNGLDLCELLKLCKICKGKITAKKLITDGEFALNFKRNTNPNRGVTLDYFRKGVLTLGIGEKTIRVGYK
jgi:ribosome-associated protein YbcJ (S4-like RNA binding protein)